MSLYQSINSIDFTLSLSSAPWNEKMDAIHRLGVGGCDEYSKRKDILRTDGQRMTGGEITMNIKLGLCSAVGRVRSCLRRRQMITAVRLSSRRVIQSLQCVKRLDRRWSIPRVTSFCPSLKRQRLETRSERSEFITVQVVSTSVSNCCLSMVSLVNMDRVVQQMERFLSSRRYHSICLSIAATKCNSPLPTASA